jgi:predicted ferric reductase
VHDLPKRQELPASRATGALKYNAECLASELPFRPKGGLHQMLMTIFVILMVLWLLGMVTSYTVYGYIHILLVIAVAVLLIRLIQGRGAV